jgi:hypothetical protein
VLNNKGSAAWCLGSGSASVLGSHLILGNLLNCSVPSSEKQAHSQLLPVPVTKLSSLASTSDL